MTAGLVVDCSAIMGFVFEDERTETSVKLLDRLLHEQFYVPDIWPIELGNVLLMGEKRKRISRPEIARFMELVGSLKMVIVPFAKIGMITELIAVARKYNISYYDAQYLHLALIKGLPLATSDKKLRAAAELADVRTVW